MNKSPGADGSRQLKLKTMTAPDQYFWYTLSTILAGALVWIVMKYIGRTEMIMTSLKETIQQLSTLVAVHDAEIIHLQESLGRPPRAAKKTITKRK